MAETAQPPTSSEGWSDCPVVRMLSFWQWQPGRSQNQQLGLEATEVYSRTLLTLRMYILRKGTAHSPGALSQGGCSNTSMDGVSQTCFPSHLLSSHHSDHRIFLCKVPGSMVGSQ